MAIFAIDFDGTIVEHEFPEIGPEKCGAIETMKALQKVGHKIIIWTCRSGGYLTAAEEWLDCHNFVPDAINENVEPLDFGLPKVYANVYLDDRSFPPFTDWKSVQKQFLNEVYVDDTKILSALEIANSKGE
jgi:hypothetical protein